MKGGRLSVPDNLHGGRERGAVIRVKMSTKRREEKEWKEIYRSVVKSFIGHVNRAQKFSF